MVSCSSIASTRRPDSMNRSVAWSAASLYMRLVVQGPRISAATPYLPCRVGGTGGDSRSCRVRQTQRSSAGTERAARTEIKNARTERAPGNSHRAPRGRAVGHCYFVPQGLIAFFSFKYPSMYLGRLPLYTSSKVTSCASSQLASSLFPGLAALYASLINTKWIRGS